MVGLRFKKMVRRGLMKMKISYFYKECYAQEDFIEIFIRPLLPSILVLFRIVLARTVVLVSLLWSVCKANILPKSWLCHFCVHDRKVATPHKTRKHRDNLVVFGGATGDDGKIIMKMKISD